MSDIYMGDNPTVVELERENARLTSERDGLRRQLAQAEDDVRNLSYKAADLELALAAERKRADCWQELRHKSDPYDTCGCPLCKEMRSDAARAAPAGSAETSGEGPVRPVMVPAQPGLRWTRRPRNADALAGTAEAEIFIAICCDRHIDEVVRVFSTLELAIQFCKDFVPERDKINEQELTTEMMRDGWLYLATYGTEGDSVRVERGKIDVSN